MRRTGQRSRIDAAPFARLVSTALLVVVPVAAPRAADVESLLLPGIDIRSIDFTVGAWCRYLVVDDAMGVVDSSDVYLAIVGRETSERGVAYWLEIASAPHGADPSDREIARALVDASVRTMADGDSLYEYVSRLYIKSGQKPVEERDPRDLKRLTIVSPTSPGDWTVTPGTALTTPAGTYSCEWRRFESTETREAPTGRVKVIQKRTDRVQLWMAPELPLFRVAKSDVQRERSVRTEPPVRGIPDAGTRKSRTTSTIVASGKNARPLLPSP